MGSQLGSTFVSECNDLQIRINGRVAETTYDLRQECGGGALSSAVCEREDGD